MYNDSVTDPNRSNISSSLPATPPPFSPHTSAVWVNSLWFSSLVVSITCALLATLLQQWARRYLKVTQTRSSLHKRARIRSFFAEGVEKNHLSMVVEALPTLVHLSVTLFFAGLVVFLWNVNLTILKVVLSLISVYAIAYKWITLIPIFRPDSPYYSPLTPLARMVVAVTLIVFKVIYHVFIRLVLYCSCFSCSGHVRWVVYLNDWQVQVLNVIRLTPEKAALKSSSELDARTLMWICDSLDEDHELERFFSGLFGFHRSKLLDAPLYSLNDPQRLRLLQAAIRLLDRTYSSDFLADQLKHQRASICSSVIELLGFVPDTPKLITKLAIRLLSEDGYGPMQSAQAVEFIRNWIYRNGAMPVVRSMYPIVVARVQRHDDRWFTLASEELGIPVTVLKKYATHSNNLSLAILIYIARRQFTYIREPFWPSKTISDVLRAATNFYVRNTSPDLKQQFCTLWNEMIQEAHHGSSGIPENILRPIRNLFISLHEGTDSAPTRFSSATSDRDAVLWVPGAYPPCNVRGHIHNDSAPTALAPDPAPSPTSLVTPVAPPFPLPEPFHADESLTTVPPNDNPYPTCQAIENVDDPVTSPDPSSAGAMRDPAFDEQESSREQRGVIATPTPQPASEASAISYPPSASVPPVAVLQSNVIPLIYPVHQTLPTPGSSAPAPESQLLTGPSLPFLSPCHDFI